MPNKKPEVGDIWRFHGLGRDFYYMVVEHHDESRDHGEYVKCLSFTKDEPPYTTEYSSRMIYDTKRWEYIA